jgi:hypothetical protein
MFPLVGKRDQGVFDVLQRGEYGFLVRQECLVTQSLLVNCSASSLQIIYRRKLVRTKQFAV